MNKKKNFNLIKIMAISIGIFMIITLAFTFSGSNKDVGIPKTNYLGLAQLGLIPTTNQCSHYQEAYSSTGVVAQTSNGDYAILESKFGDEYCPVRIK